MHPYLGLGPDLLEPVVLFGSFGITETGGPVVLSWGPLQHSPQLLTCSRWGDGLGITAWESGLHLCSLLGSILLLCTFNYSFTSYTLPNAKTVRNDETPPTVIKPEGGNCKVCQDIGKLSTSTAVKLQKLKPHTLSSGCESIRTTS